MLIKLATQNVKRSQGYFFAYALTIGILFTIIYQLSNIQLQLESQATFATAEVGALSVAQIFNVLKYFMYAVVIFFTAYISRFFIKRRNKEIALLKTLGLNRKSIWTMFLIENLIIVVLGVIIGLALGVLSSRLFSYAAMNLMGFRATNIGFSVMMSGVVNVILLMIIIYIVMAIVPLKAIAKSSIIQLMGDQVKNDEVKKRPFFSFIIFIISLAALLFMALVVMPNNESLNMSLILIYLALASIVAITLYRGFVLNYFYTFRTKGKGLGKPVKQLAMAHLGSSVKSLYKIMSFITIISAIVTVFITTTFGFLDNMMKTAAGQMEKPLILVSNQKAEMTKYHKLLSKYDIDNKTFQLLNTSNFKENDNYDITKQNLLVMSSSQFNKLAKYKGYDLRASTNLTSVKNENCSVMESYCDVIKSNNINDLKYDKKVREVVSSFEEDYIPYSLYNDKTPNSSKIMNNFRSPNILILSDAQYNKLNTSNFTNYYMVTTPTSPQKNEFFKYNDLFTKDALLDKDSIAVLDQTPIILVLSQSAIGLMQLILLLMSIVTVIALMMSIFFRTLENMERGINEYVIAKQIGMSRKQIYRATFIEAIFSQLFPFALGVVVSLFLFNQMFYSLLEEGQTILNIVFEPSNVIILGSLFAFLIALVIILVVLINTRIAKQKTVK